MTGVTPRPVVDDVWVLSSAQASPVHGLLPVNAFVVADPPAVLVDTGLASQGDDLLAALGRVVPPEELAVVFLSHEDADHAGNLGPVLAAAPRARLVTNYVTLGRLLEGTEVPLDRVDVVNAGHAVPGSGGRLRAVRPPVYDAPGTLGLHDPGSGVVFTADAFGAYVLPGVDASPSAPADLVAGMLEFNSVNHPWTTVADPDRLGRAIDAIAALAPRLLLSSHGPVPYADAELLLDALKRSPYLEPHVPPDQAGFDRLRDQLR